MTESTSKVRSESQARRQTTRELLEEQSRRRRISSPDPRLPPRDDKRDVEVETDEEAAREKHCARVV